MIKIVRTACPASLDKPPDQFREKDYVKQDVTDALLKMQYEKCCYCETRFSKGEVDHYRPKRAEDFKDENGDTQWYLANDWNNLLYVCRDCNGSKLGQLPFNETTGERELINPTLDEIDPEEHIDFILDSEYFAYNERGKSVLGMRTCEILKFSSRKNLIGAFCRIALEIDTFFLGLQNDFLYNDNDGVEARKNILPKMMNANCEFAAFRRAYIRMRIKKFNKLGIPYLSLRLRRKLEPFSINYPKGAEVI